MNQLKSNKLIWNFLWAVTLLFVACKSTEPDFRFFEESGSCLPPCWNDIMPGETVKENALTTLSNTEYISATTISESNLQDVGVNEFSFYLDGGSQGGIVIRDNIVYEVFLIPDFRLTLLDFIDRIGPPDYIYRQLRSSEKVCHETHLYYPNRGIMVYLYECEKHNGEEQSLEISGKELVSNIVYFPPTTEPFEKLVLDLWKPFEESAYLISANTDSWVGFGDYVSHNNAGIHGIPRPISAK